MGLDKKNYGAGRKITSLGLGLFMFFTLPRYAKDSYDIDFFYESLPLNKIKAIYYTGDISDGQLMDLFDGFKERFNNPEADDILDEIRDKTIAKKIILGISRRKYGKGSAIQAEQEY